MHIFRIRILLPALFGITVLFSIAQGGRKHAVHR